MAEKTSRIVCCICLSDFKQPKLIDCHHSFCLHCLEGYVEKFAINHKFPCPLCRRDVTIPDGGVKHFSSNFYIDDKSPTTDETQPNPQKQKLCDVCKSIVCNYKCVNCDKDLCVSCKSNHDIFLAGQNHQVQELKRSEFEENIPERKTKTVPKDVCINHSKKDVKYYCQNCTEAICFSCFSENHKQHQCLDLTNEHRNKHIREELLSLKHDLEIQISKFKYFSDFLDAKIIDVSNEADTICFLIDERVQNVYEETKDLGEKVKLKASKWRDEEHEKFSAKKKEVQIQCETVQGYVDNSDIILKNNSYVQILEILPNVRKEKRETSVLNLDFLEVTSAKFLEGKIDSLGLAKQFGNLAFLEKSTLKLTHVSNRSTRSCLVEGKTFCFTTKYNVNNVEPFTEEDDMFWCCPDDYDIPWSVGVGYDADTLCLVLRLNAIDDEIIKYVEVTYKYKLLKTSDDKRYVSKPYKSRLTPGDASWGGYIGIHRDELKNKHAGFIDLSNDFRIQTTITLTEIEYK